MFLKSMVCTTIVASFLLLCSAATVETGVENVSHTFTRTTCTSDESCPSGKVCAGTTKNMRCVMPMKLFGRCKADPFWVCEKGLECRGGQCLPPISTMGQSCLPPGSECAEGLVCAGNDRKKRCVRVRPVFARCRASRFSTCAEGLECRDGKCLPPIAARGESCLPRGSECASGLVCAGTATKKRCVAPMGVGKQCAIDPFWVCAEGLKCVNNVCERPVATQGESCLPPGTQCAEGLVCAGTSTNKKCVREMPVFGKCKDDPFWICEAGLECRGETCLPPVSARGESCLPPGSMCASGSVCAGTSTKKRCVKPMGVGMQCEVDPFWVCAEHLKCVYNVCVA